MFGDKGHDPLVALDQIGIDEVPVIVAIKVDLAKNQVGAMVGNRSQNHLILAEKKNAGKGHPTSTAFRIRLVKLRTLQHLQIIQAKPRVICPMHPGKSPTFGEQIEAKLGQAGMRKDLVLRIGGLLSLIERPNQSGVIANIEVAIFIAIKNTAIAAMNL